MLKSIKRGFSFGITSGVITTLGLIIGLTYSTQSRLAVIGGILTIAVADALSDALGVHISEESDEKKSHMQIWSATISTAITKFIIALTFMIPVLFLSLNLTVLISIFWGALLIMGISYYISKKEGIAPLKAMAEHLTIAGVVVIITFFLGTWINHAFV